MNDFTTFPSRIIGGPSGNYSLQCDVTNGQWAEFTVVTVANGGSQPGFVMVSGDSPACAITLKQDGSQTLTDGVAAKGIAFAVDSYTTLFGQPDCYERITHSQRYIFLRIDCGANASIYVAVRFRIRNLEVIPDMPPTTHPELMEAANVAREKRIRDALKTDMNTVTRITASPEREKIERGLLKGQR